MITRLKRALGRLQGEKDSYALDQLDLKLLEFVNYPKGFFVEAGANDGVRYSNSLYFEKYMKWKGLLIEGIPALAEKCRQNRPGCIVENCALVSFDYSGSTIDMQYSNFMSIVKGAFGSEEEDNKYLQTGEKFLPEGEETYTVTVPAKTLSSILDAHNIQKVDLLSLDVEGYELNVLQGIDFSRHAPAYLLLEIWHDKKDEIFHAIAPYYKRLSILNSNESYADVLYQRK